jgi:hypothetical protein
VTTVAEVIDYVERELAAFYGFALLARAKDHLASRRDLEASLGRSVQTLPEFKARAGVFLQEPGDSEELFIGIHYDDAVLESLDRKNPLERLDDENLDAFCVLVEELSHFHLILNRMERRQGVSKLELEWQGEVDKLLVSAVTLEDQAGDLHLSPLARRLFDQATITAEDQELYWQAHRQAARLWFAVAQKAEGLTPRLREILRQSYHAPWADKVARFGRVA